MNLEDSIMGDSAGVSGGGSDPNLGAFAEGDSYSASNTDVEMDDKSSNQLLVNNYQDAGVMGSCVLPTAVIVNDETSDMASDNFFSQVEQIGWGDLSSSGQIPQLTETEGGGIGGFESFDGRSTAGMGDFGVVKQETFETPAASVSFDRKKVIPEGTFKIFVSNIPQWFKNQDLAELFQAYGNIIECEIFTFKNFAFVHLDNEQGGLRAIREVNGIDVGGSKLSVQRSKAVNPDQKNKIVPTSRVTSTDEVGSYKLYISNLQMGVTKEFVAKILEGYGRIVEIEIYRGNSAFVHMEEEEAGKKIIQELDGHFEPEIGKSLSVSESKNPEGPSLPTIKLQVKNIGSTATAEMIRSLFQPYGMVIKCSVTNSKFGMLRRAIVHLEQLGDIRSAIKDLSNYELDGNKLIVEAVFEDEKPMPQNQPSLQNQKKKPAPFMSKKPQPLITQGMQFRGRGRGRGFGQPQSGGGRGKFQLIPMPTVQDLNQMPTLAARGRGRGRGGFGRPFQGFVPRHHKRPYQNSGFDQDDYDFDEYYQDPTAASSRDHIAGLQQQYDQYENETFQQSGNTSGDYQSMDYPFGEREYYPPQKKSRGKPGGLLNTPGGSLLPSLMGLNVQQTPSAEEVVQIPYQPYAYPSLNFPLGEREYFSNFKQGNKTQQQAKAPVNSGYSGAQRNQPTFQQFQQAKLQQQDYFSSDHNISSPIGNGLSNSDFQYSTAYPSNYYAGVDNFSAVPFDYNAMKKPKNGPQYQQQWQKPAASGTPLKQGAKMYLNGTGKVMVRGNRGGKKARRPGLGSRGNNNNGGSNNSANGGVMSANQVPIGGAGPSSGPSNSNKFSQNYNTNSAAGGNSKYKSKQQVKDDNQEYSDWLQQKAWLYQAIPGTVKPANK